MKNLQRQNFDLNGILNKNLENICLILKVTKLISNFVWQLLNLSIYIEKIINNLILIIVLLFGFLFFINPL